ncbi:bifunctional 2-polyprenyl-6-hydroxyphenol methylase/3-demethylubiquinol 3-O-methyltransferase UbiG [Janthinobacterium sp. PAMC25594]|uniref:class I SAM-dependent methyltransferase n=1 Tax=Janthinobacterium sp. PAMC25594 TaxID=2861284 RepID=UPI001C628FF7|nr:class I SAM-dependent methyltransferase [Janthinobacterium sp. PAMC25594]QYG08689.1 class I SAM-dependent methyltransferase [Janthinobacterium sp. PAMC25594]
MSTRISGTEGYAEEARFLVERWKNISFESQHQIVLDLIPTVTSKVLDIGSGIGTDAAAFFAMGHQVVAVEPTEELRTPGIELHMEYGIEWLDDSLPDLSILRARKEAFDVIMLTAVWMHLDEVQRCRAMPVIASLLSAAGIIIMSLRHGPVPNGRRMFEVTAAETIELAALQGLQLVLNIRTQSVSIENRIAGVSWTRLAFRR